MALPAPSVHLLRAPVSALEQDLADFKLVSVGVAVEALDLALQLYGFPHPKTAAAMHHLRDIVGPNKHP